jgi:hypothetical protein
MARVKQAIAPFLGGDPTIANGSANGPMAAAAAPISTESLTLSAFSSD